MNTIHLIKDKKLYEQIYTYFKSEILSGNLKWKDKLPSRRALAQHLGVSLNTIKTAYEQLLDEGYIVSDERRGFFVDKIYIENLVETKEEKFHLPSKIEPKYNFSHSEVDMEKLPISILRKCANNAIENINEFKMEKGGNWDLRIEIAKYLKQRRGVTVSPENIIVTSGFEEHIMILKTVINNPIFALEDPGYKKIFEALKDSSGKVFHIPLDKYGFSVAHLENTEANVAIVTPNHQFPTGQIMVLRRRQRLLAWAEEKNDRFIIEDDYDSDFKYVGSPIPALKSLDKSDKVILSGSFSKNVGKFLGISYLVLPNSLKEEYNKLEIPTSGASSIQQGILMNFMKSGGFEKHLNRMNTNYKKKRSTIIKQLKNIKNIEILGADAGTFLILRIDNKKFDVDKMKYIFNKENIKINFISDYCILDKYKNELILGFGAISEKEVDESMEYLIKIIKSTEVL